MKRKTRQIPEMHILQICPKPPLPSVDGGALAMLSATEGLQQNGASVKILTVATEKHPFLPEKISEAFKSSTQIEAVFIDTTVKRIPALLNLFSSSSYNVNRFYSIEFEKKLKSILENETFDLIQLESLFVAPYMDCIRKYSKAKIVLRAHNVESDLWKRKAEQEKKAFNKSWFKNLAKKLFNYEKKILQEIDALIPITNEDAKTFSEMLNGKNIPIHVLPFAMRLPDLHSEIIPKPFTVFHLGSMDWSPNVEGVNWLVKKVWPEVLAKIPAAELHLAGRGLKKDEATFQGKNIFIHGEVENAFAFMNEFSIMTIPLLSGGGMRVKLVEGMALGKTIVTTSIGAEGTGVTNNEQALIENSPEKFADKICHLLSDAAFAKKIAENARKFAKTNFEIVSASKKLSDFYTTLLK